MLLVYLGFFLSLLNKLCDFKFCDASVDLNQNYIGTVRLKPSILIQLRCEMGMRLNQMATYSRLTNLHNEHVISVHALSGEVTHVANQPRLSTSRLSHDDHWNTTPVCVCVCV